jgi:hypothetical protein
MYSSIAFKQKFVAKITYWSRETKNVKLNDAKKKHTLKQNEKCEANQRFFHFEAKKVGLFLFETKMVKRKNVKNFF